MQTFIASSMAGAHHFWAKIRESLKKPQKVKDEAHYTEAQLNFILEQHFREKKRSRRYPDGTKLPTDHICFLMFFINQTV